MEDVNTYLNEDASDEDRQAAQLLEEGFAAMRLEEKVGAAVTQRQALEQQGRLRRIFGALILLIILVGAWWWKNQAIEDEIVPPKKTELRKEQQEQQQPVEEPEDTPPTEEINNEAPVTPPNTPPPPPNIPIAQADPGPSLAPPPYGAPDTYLRGQNEEKEGKALLDQLWYTAYPLQGLTPGEQFAQVDELLQERTFPMAYVRLQRLDRQLEASDTLRYLQAYTLLEMGQGQEALLLMDQMEDPPASWAAQMEWYRGLANLLMDDKAAALIIFQELAEQPSHPYQFHAQTALQLYK